MHFLIKRKNINMIFLQIFPVTGIVPSLEFVKCKQIFGLDWDYDTRELNRDYNSHSTFGWIKWGTRKIFCLFGSCTSQSHPCLTLSCDTASLLKYIKAFWKIFFFGYYHFKLVLWMLAYSSFMLESLHWCSRLGESSLKTTWCKNCKLVTFRSNLGHACVVFACSARKSFELKTYLDRANVL